MSRKRWTKEGRRAKRNEGRRRERQAEANNVRTLKRCLTCSIEIAVKPHELPYYYQHRTKAQETAERIAAHQRRVAARKRS